LIAGFAARPTDGLAKVALRCGEQDI
jgi:hypothetical protein